jgi:glucosylceramidase
VTGEITRNVEYYVLGHASRFVRPGARRIASDSGIEGLETVAFRNPGKGKIVLIVLNTADQPRRFSVGTGADRFFASLSAGSVATYIWSRGRTKK